MQRNHKLKNRARDIGVKILPAMLAVCMGYAQASPGDLNIGFGSGGILTTPIKNANAQGYGVTTDKMGRVLVAGRFEKDKSGKSKCTLVRYLTDGSLDMTFGKNGTGVVNACGDVSGGSGLNTVRVDSKNRIVVAGRIPVSGPSGTVSAFAVSRYLDDGTLDRRFGSKGVAYALAEDSIAYSVAFDSSDRIVVAGVFSPIDPSDEVYGGVVRFTETGALDKSFGVDGVVRKTDGWDIVVAVDSADRIVVGGNTTDTHAVFVDRYLSSGTPDSSFGTSGEFATSLTSGALLNAMAVDKSDRPIVGAVDEASWDFAVARLTTSGALDTTFGAGTGYVLTSVDTRGGALLDAVALDSHDRILASGGAYYGESGVIVRYLPDGTIDSSFGSGGMTYLINTASTNYAANSMTLDGNGHATLVGTATTGAEDQLMLAQFNLGD